MVELHLSKEVSHRDLEDVVEEGLWNRPLQQWYGDNPSIIPVDPGKVSILDVPADMVRMVGFSLSSEPLGILVIR